MIFLYVNNVKFCWVDMIERVEVSNKVFGYEESF